MGIQPIVLRADVRIPHGRAGERVQDHGQRPTTRGSRSSSTSSTTPGEGTPGADDSFAASTTPPIPPQPRGPALLRDYTGTGNTLDATSPRVLPRSGLAALRDPRHALDGFASNASALAPSSKTSKARQLLRHNSPGPVITGQAHRRAVGAAGGYQAGNFPVGGPSGTGNSRHGSSILEGNR